MPAPPPDASPTVIQAAARALAEGRPEEAVARLEALALAAPAYPAAQVLLARALEAADRPDAATEAWHRAHFLVPNSPLVQRERQRFLDRLAAAATDETLDGALNEAPLTAPVDTALDEASDEAGPEAGPEAGLRPDEHEQAEAPIAEAEAPPAEAEHDVEPEAPEHVPTEASHDGTGAEPGAEEAEPPAEVPEAADEVGTGAEEPEVAPSVEPDEDPDAAEAAVPESEEAEAVEAEAMEVEAEATEVEADEEVIERIESEAVEEDGGDAGVVEMEEGEHEMDEAEAVEAAYVDAEAPGFEDEPTVAPPDLAAPSAEPVSDAADGEAAWWRPELPAARPEADEDADGWAVIEETDEPDAHVAGPAEPRIAVPDDLEPPAPPPDTADTADADAPLDVEALAEVEHGAGAPADETDKPALADELDLLIRQLEDAPRIRPDPTFHGPEVAFDEDIADDMVSETLARIYAAQRQYAEAAIVYEKLAQQRPEQAEDLLRRAEEMRQQKGS